VRHRRSQRRKENRVPEGIDREPRSALGAEDVSPEAPTRSEQGVPNPSAGAIEGGSDPAAGVDLVSPTEAISRAADAFAADPQPAETQLEPPSTDSHPEQAERVDTHPDSPPAGATIEVPKRKDRPGALALLRIERIESDDSLRLREEGVIDSLATSIAKLGQLFPVELRLRPPDRFQIITGFRRVSALRLLKRERVLARVHTDLSDEEALRIALADLLEHRGATPEELIQLRERLRAEGRLTAAVKESLERAIAPPDEALAPEMVEGSEEEIDLDELTQDVTGRLAAVNQDLALVAELWSALEPPQREALLEQLAYPEQLVRFLKGR
jgi:ParB-like chromosome segregation protein Spo0J